MGTITATGRKTAVFDLDGTLVHTSPDLLDSLNRTLVGTGVAVVPELGFHSVVGHGGRAMIARAFTSAGKALDPTLHDRLYKQFLADYADNIPGRSAPFPGAVAALDRLQAAGYLVAICTNKTEGLATRLVEALGLRPRFDAICGLDTFAFCKPDPRHLTETIAKAGGDSGAAVMIGDSRNDIDTAKAAGIPVVAVDFGYTERHVREFEPSAIISHYDALTPALTDRLIAAYS